MALESPLIIVAVMRYASEGRARGAGTQGRCESDVKQRAVRS